MSVGEMPGRQSRMVNEGPENKIFEQIPAESMRVSHLGISGKSIRDRAC